MNYREQGEASTLECPRCRITLAVGHAPDATMHACGQCGGIWLDNEASRVAMRGFSEGTMEMVNRVTANAKTDVNTAGPPPPCPACGKPLQRVRHAEADIDVCAEHGTWFDRHELFRVARAALTARAPVPIAGPAYGPPPMPAAYGQMPFSTWAIVGFILSFFCGILGLIFSIMGYKECERTHMRGKGLAIAGVAISIGGMILGCLNVMASSR